MQKRMGTPLLKMRAEKTTATKMETTSYYHSKNFHLLPVVMEKIKPIFKDLCKTDPLEKCHKDETLNPNESLNNIIWSVIPKRVFVMLPTLRYGSFSDFFTIHDSFII